MEESELSKKAVYEAEKVTRKNEGKSLSQKWKVNNTSRWISVGILLFGALFAFWKMSSSDTPQTSSLPSSTTAPTVASMDALTVQADDWVKGDKDAPVTLIEYLDFECESCGAYYPIIKELEKEFGAKLRVVTRYFPLPGHKNSMQAALAAEAAGRQGKYFEMHDLLFESQKEWAEKPAADPKLFVPYAEKLGLNLEQFNRDREDKAVKERVERNKAEGNKLKINGTPSFFLNGTKIQNPRTKEDFTTLIQAEVLKAPVVKTVGEKPLGEKVHEHADFAVYLNGKKFDFTQAKYQSSKTNPLDPEAHLHDSNGTVTHKHRKGVTLGYFFKSIGMDFTNECFTLDSKESFCNSGDKKLKFYVNGQPNGEFGKYEFTDLDRILITYGSEGEATITTQQSSIADDACLYSEKCPERGKPPTENCVGGLGTEC